MYCFIVTHRPKSYNKWRKNPVGRQAYVDAIQNSFRINYSDHELLSGELYGMVYHFYKKDLFQDADNISKPIWDSLISIVYSDDKQIKLRIAGSFDLTQKDFTELDFSNIPGNVISDFLTAIDNETQDHFLYVECGELKSEFFQFNIENNGN